MNQDSVTPAFIALSCFLACEAHGARQIVYEFRLETDSYAQPWGGEVALNATQDNRYEYACHEGHYALPAILAGEREAERAAGARGQ